MEVSSLDNINVQESFDVLMDRVIGMIVNENGQVPRSSSFYYNFGDTESQGDK